MASGAAAQDKSDVQGPWWLGYLLTALGAVLGALLIVWQLGRQHTSAIQLQRENFKGELKLKVYQEFSSTLSTSADVLGVASNYAFCGPMHIAVFVQQQELAINASPIADRAKTFSEKHYAAVDGLVEVIFLIEKYIVIHHDLEIFKLAVGCSAHDMADAFGDLFDFMVQHFPFDIDSPSGLRIERIKGFSAAEIEQHKKLVNRYNDVSSTTMSYLSDMRLELQMLLMNELFPGPLPRRRPIDPALKVISLEPSAVKSLRQYFLTKTDYGKGYQKIQAEVYKGHHGNGLTAPATRASFKRD